MTLLARLKRPQTHSISLCPQRQQATGVFYVLHVQEEGARPVVTVGLCQLLRKRLQGGCSHGPACQFAPSVAGGTTCAGRHGMALFLPPVKPVPRPLCSRPLRIGHKTDDAETLRNSSPSSAVSSCHAPDCSNPEVAHLAQDSSQRRRGRGCSVWDASLCLCFEQCVRRPLRC